jgi:hypothetical protein
MYRISLKTQIFSKSVSQKDHSEQGTENKGSPSNGKVHFKSDIHVTHSKIMVPPESSSQYLSNEYQGYGVSMEP